MKAKRLLILVGLLSMLASCQANPTSNTVVPSNGGSVASTDTAGQTGSSQVSGDNLQHLDSEQAKTFGDMLIRMGQGFSADGTISNSTAGKDRTLAKMAIQSTPTGYHLTQYQAVSYRETPNDYSVASEVSYASRDDGLTYVPYLSVGNKVRYKPLISAGSQPTWRESGYANAFQELSVSDFEAKSDSLYVLVFKSSDNAQRRYAKLARLLSGQENFDLSYLSLSVTDGHIAAYQAILTSKDDASTADVNETGLTSITIDGRILAFGENVTIEPETPVEGTEDPTFKAAMESLATSNYKVDSRLIVSDPALGVNVNQTQSGVVFKGEDGKTKIVLDANPNATGFANRTGYYQSETARFTQFLELDNGFYANGKQFIGNLEGNFVDGADIHVPSFDISSLFFKRIGTSNTWVFDPAKGASFANGAVFSPFNVYTDVYHLTVTINADSVTFKNFDDKGNISDTETYSYIGKVSDPFVAETFHATTDGATWNDLLSYSQDALDMVSKAIGLEALSQIPVVGGTHAEVYAVNYQDSLLLMVPAFDEADAGRLANSYKTALTDTYGFSSYTDPDTLVTTFSKKILKKKDVVTLNLSFFVTVNPGLGDTVGGQQMLFIEPSVVED